MKKNILFLESRYDSFYGAQKSMLQFIRGLDLRKFNYKIVTTKEGQFKEGFNSNDFSVDIIKLGKKTNVFGGKVLEYSLFDKLIVMLQIIFFNLKLISYIVRHKIDYIYVNDVRSLLYSIIATKILRKKNIWYIRSDISNSKLSKFCLKYSDHIITIAKGVLRNIPTDSTKEYEHKIINIYTGFDFNQFNIIDKHEAKRNLEIYSEKLVIGYLGSINERKGIDLLVDSYIDLAKRYNNIELLIVGNISSGHDDYWKKQIEKLANANVCYKYFPYTSNISKIYRAMDIFVLPSRSEGLPRVLIEAIGHKIPVIATDVGGVREIISDQDTGIIVEKNDVKNLNLALETVIQNPAYLNVINKKAYKQIKQKFSIERFNNEINVFLKSL